MTPNLGEKICSRQEGSEKEFLDRFEQSIFCLCMVRLGDRQSALRWTSALMEESLAALQKGPPLADRELALFVSNHARGRVLSSAWTGDPPLSRLRPFDAASLLLGPAFHRMVLDAMQTLDKRLLYRLLSQRMSPEEIGADLKLDPRLVPEVAAESAERALRLMRLERQKHQQRQADMKAAKS